MAKEVRKTTRNKAEKVTGRLVGHVEQVVVQKRMLMWDKPIGCFTNKSYGLQSHQNNMFL